MRVGIIGCGNIAKVHVWALQNLGTEEIAAFSDCKLEKAEKMSKESTGGKAIVFQNYIDMLDKAGLDVVHICTPHYLHVPMAIEALKRNITVFMEKPPAVTREEFENLTELSKTSEARIGFCFQNRYNQTTIKLDELIKEKDFGRLAGVRGFVTWKREADYYSDDWHGSLEKECGGALLNQSIHTLDLMLRYLGKPEKVAASMKNHHLQGVMEVEDTIEAWLETADGKRAGFYATTAYALDAPVIMELNFERGRITLIDDLLQVYEAGKEPEFITCRAIKPGIGKSYWGSGHLACIEDFYNCLNSGERYQNDLEGISNILYTTMSIYECAGK